VSFSVLERVKLAEKILAAGVRDSDPTTQWYESTNPELLVVLSDRVWTQGGLVRQYPAANLTVARANAAGPLAGVVQDYSQPVDSVRLTPDVAVNNTFIALTTYGDYSSARLDQWVQPQVVPQTSGLPSFGYSVRLYDGDPNAGGTEVLTTDGTTGTGINKSVGWIWSYTNGVLMLADDFAVADPWILGFRYIGDTVDDIVSTLKLSSDQCFWASSEGNFDLLDGQVEIGGSRLHGCGSSGYGSGLEDRGPDTCEIRGGSPCCLEWRLHLFKQRCRGGFLDSYPGSRESSYGSGGPPGCRWSDLEAKCDLRTRIRVQKTIRKENKWRTNLIISRS
jgi:hypothetical protein